MKSKFGKCVTIIGVILGTVLIAYAVTSLFLSKNETSSLAKKTIFQFDLTTGMQSAEIGPGDSFVVSPTVYNDATENMYVFITIKQPTYNNESLYSYNISDAWKLVSSTADRQVYAYSGEEMTTLNPGETTEPLMSQMSMKSISNAEYAQIDDINVNVTAYAIGTEDVSSVPEEAWTMCKYLGNFQ